jgi:Resolvase, N terminal domain
LHKIIYIEKATIFCAKDMHESEASSVLTVFGYARVSTSGQTLAARDVALRGAGCAKVYAETASGAKSDRAELRKVVSRLGEGDVLTVTRLDRLARSARDLLNVLDDVAKRGAGFRSLADAWADTTTPHGRLMLTGPGRVRTHVDPCPHRRRPGPGKSRWRAHGPAAEADAAPAPLGYRTA